MGEKGVEAADNKVTTIKKLSRPQNVRSLRRFLGMASYYRNFIYNFSSIAKPLTEFTFKKVKFVWTDVHDVAFNTLKQALCESPVLAHPNYNKPI